MGYVGWCLRLWRALSSAELQAWACTWRLRAEHVSGVAGWVTLATWGDPAPDWRAVAVEGIRGWWLGAARLRLQVEDGAGRVVYSLWCARKGAAMKQDLVEKEPTDATLADMARAAHLHGAGELMKGGAEMTRAYTDGLSKVVETFMARIESQQGYIEHLQVTAAESGARAAIAEIWFGRDVAKPPGWATDVKDLIKELSDVGFSLGGLWKGDPDKLLDAWRSASSKGSKDKGGPMLVAGCVGRLLKRMNADEWSALGGLIGPETAEEVGQSLLRALGPEKVARMMSAGLRSGALDVGALWRGLGPDARGALVSGIIGSLTPEERQQIGAFLGAA